MKYRLVAFAVLSVAVCLFETANALALQSQNGTKDCGANGTLFTNLGSEPTDFELSADWGRPCELTLAWTDASGQPQTMKLATPGQPTQGISSSLGKGGVVSWSTAPSSLPIGVGGGEFNWQLERPPLAPQHSDSSEAEHHGDDDGSRGSSATFGSVGGGFGAVASTPVSCGSSGTLYSNLASAPIALDLIVTNYTNGDVYSCALTMSWVDQNGQTQTLVVGPGSSQGVSATSLPGGGVISWTSSGTAPGGLSMTWQVDRAVLIPVDGREGSR